MESDFNSSDLTAIFGQRASYDSKTSYYGGHLGLGYAFQASARALPAECKLFGWNF